MKLQPESKKELLRIAGGTAFCTAIMWVLFAALHLVGWVVFDYRVLLGGIIGALVAIGNFAGICFVVQKVIDEPDEKKRKAQLQISYNTRMLLQALWIIIAIAALELMKSEMRRQLNVACAHKIPLNHRYCLPLSVCQPYPPPVT